MQYKMLIVDDEKGLITTMKYYFEKEGYLVSTALDGEDALKKISFNPDIILLDINMPKMNGLEFLEQTREHISCPILFLTARITKEDKINGLTLGSDDYIIKPFDLDEVNARVKAHLRRENRGVKQNNVRFFSEITVDYSKRQVLVSGAEIPFSKRQFDIVELLTLNAGMVYDKERIYEKIWGYDGEGDSNTIKEHVRKIRLAFAEHTDRECIETVWGVGYKWAL